MIEFSSYSSSISFFSFNFSIPPPHNSLPLLYINIMSAMIRHKWWFRGSSSFCLVTLLSSMDDSQVCCRVPLHSRLPEEDKSVENRPCWKFLRTTLRSNSQHICPCSVGQTQSCGHPHMQGRLCPRGKCMHLANKNGHNDGDASSILLSALGLPLSTYTAQDEGFEH